MLSNLLLADWLIDDVVPEDVNDVEYDVADVDAVTDDVDDVDDVTRLLVFRFIVAVSSIVDTAPVGDIVGDRGVTGVKGGEDDDELIVSNFSSTSKSTFPGRSLIETFLLVIDPFLK